MRGCGRISNKWVTLRDLFIVKAHSILSIAMIQDHLRFETHGMFWPN